ncbi:MAG TPA: VOC family protein [Actinoplanes sp.]|nr:VOC family protein [Actinoplanes sp.]
MRMLHLGLRVTDLDRSLAFYTALGYAEVGRVPETGFGSLTMLKLPDDPFVSLELAYRPSRRRSRDRGCGRPGSPIPTATGSRSCNGHPAIRPV